ncbi:hypothetical protein H6G14_29910 [Nostoc parmelioides FACHB-3921]|uniref:SnoaL-like domain-containing protein n=1 Tax=Nostoc parmelioides FACHB-3921 TaxID=2692909 RepID=A0ABR8BP14_9NOSO|nr:hypothetical protein [Nostoc parmelioides]MBD2255429.1 hypothetical protein [Nostoc parmelioides FACHB-3921]
MLNKLITFLTLSISSALLISVIQEVPTQAKDKSSLEMLEVQGGALRSHSSSKSNSLAAPVVTRNCTGTSSDGFTPPDTHGLMGTTQFVEVTNSRINVFRKVTNGCAPAPQLNQTLNAFFGYSRQTSFESIMAHVPKRRNVFRSPRPPRLPILGKGSDPALRRTPQELFGLLRQYIIARNIPAILSIHDREAGVVEFGGGVARGAEAIFDLYANFFASDPVLDARPLQIIEAGGVAIILGEYTLDFKDENGVAQRVTGKFADMVRQEPNGKSWLYLLDNPYAPF